MKIKGHDEPKAPSPVLGLACEAEYEWGARGEAEIVCCLQVEEISFFLLGNTSMYLQTVQTAQDEQQQMNQVNEVSSRVTFTIFCCSETIGAGFESYLFPMTSLSLCRASSAACWEEKCTYASPVFLPLWFVTMVIPFSTISKPANENEILSFAFLKFFCLYPLCLKRWENFEASYLKKTGRYRPPCSWRGDLWPTQPCFELELLWLSLGWFRRRCSSLRTLETHKEQEV